MSAAIGVKGHVIRMWLDHGQDSSLSVATCECGGFEHRVEWGRDTPATLPRKRQDKAIAMHWREVRPR